MIGKDHTVVSSKQSILEKTCHFGIRHNTVLGLKKVLIHFVHGQKLVEVLIEDRTYSTRTTYTGITMNPDISAAIISDAEAKAAELVDKTGKECVVFSVEENAKSDKKIELAGKRYAAKSEQAAKLILLNARQNIIESTLTDALTAMEKAEPKEYFDMLLKHISSFASSI